MPTCSIFCAVDDFCQAFIPDWQRRQLSGGERKRRRDCRLTPSEIMTLIIHFHQSQYRNFKAYYLLHVCKHLKGAFPNLVSYTRFVALMPSVLLPLCVYLNTRKGPVTGLAFIDATAIVVGYPLKPGHFVSSTT